jgi:hypothetical protein
MLKLDYVSCILTIISTVLIGKRLWQGWVIAGANSIIICVIGMRSAQFGFVPANLSCIGLDANNLWNWRPKTQMWATPPVSTGLLAANKSQESWELTLVF